MSQDQTPLQHIGEVSREDLVAAFTRHILDAPIGTVFVLTAHQGSNTAALRASVPYASGEARSWAADALERGRVAAASPAIGTRVSEATPIDELLFAVAESRERAFRAIAAAHAAIPEALASRKETTMGDATEALAARIKQAIKAVAAGADQHGACAPVLSNQPVVMERADG